MVVVTIISGFEAQENKVSHYSIVSLFICHDVMGPDARSSFFECWILSHLFLSPLPLSSRDSLVLLHFLPLGWYHLHYLSLLIFLPTVLIPGCASFSLAFHMMYSAYKLNKQGDNIQPWRTPFPVLNQSVVPCPVLTVSAWPANKFLRRQVRWSGTPISLRIFHSLLWSTQSL